MTRLLSLVLLSAVFALSACTSEKIELLKSPCAGIDGSPCGPKRAMNGPEHSQLAPAALAERV